MQCNLHLLLYTNGYLHNYRAEFILSLRKLNRKHVYVYPFIDYRVKDDTILEPDILIVCKEIKKKYLDFPPALIVEILSPTTALKDRHTKYEIYRQQGVKYYIIVNTDAKSIEVFELVNYKYEIKKDNYRFILDENCIIDPDLSNIFN